MRAPQTLVGRTAPVADRVVFGGVWALGMAYQVLGCDSPDPVGHVQAFLLGGMAAALAVVLVSLLVASHSAPDWAFAACFCGLLAATLDLPADAAVAVREMGLYGVLGLITGAFGLRWDIGARRRR